MVRPLPFQILQNLAQKQKDDAYQAVAQAVQARQIANEQLDTLLQYRQDYLGRIQSTLENGTRSSVIFNMQSFIDNIDQAIVQQRQKIEALESTIAQRRQSWDQARVKEQSMATLLHRQASRAQIAQGRYEQKQNDEYAARAYRMGRSTL